MDHAGMRGGGDVWHFKPKKKERQEVLQHSGRVKKQLHFVFVVLFFKEDAERHPKGLLLDCTKEHHTHTRHPLMTYRAVGNGGMYNIDECTTYFSCWKQAAAHYHHHINNHFLLECLSFLSWVCVCVYIYIHKYYKKKGETKEEPTSFFFLFHFFDVITTTSSSPSRRVKMLDQRLLQSTIQTRHNGLGSLSRSELGMAGDMFTRVFWIGAEKKKK